MGAELRLELAGREKLIDFGADDFVYTGVRTGEMAMLEARPINRKYFWIVSRGKPGSLTRQVVGTTASGVGGWAHVMDRTRCTAVAVANFAKSTRDRFEVDGKGRLLMYREFGKAVSTGQRVQRSFEFWVHFVGMPVHIGARTSPQAMRAPLQVRLLK